MFTATKVLRSSATKRDPSLLKGDLHLALLRRNNTKGNSRCERADPTVWRTVKLLLHDKNLAEDWREIVLPEALYAVRSLVCLATNQWNASRRAMTETSLPSWLLTTGPVLQRCFVQRKDDPLTNEVQLLEANPSYTAVRFSDWRESSISTSDLAPLPESPVGLVDTCGDFDDVRCNQPELSPDTMD